MGLGLSEYGDDMHEPTIEEMVAAACKRNPKACYECELLLLKGKWKKVPSGYGNNVEEVRIFGTPGVKRLCQGHQDEMTNTFGCI